MAITDLIIQGGDYELDFVISDDAGTAIDLTTLAGYIVILYLKDKNNTVLQQYSRQTKPGFKSLTETDATNGKFQVKLQSADTKTGREEIIFAEVKIETADVTFDDNTLHNPDTGIVVATLVQSQTEQYTDLTS